MKKAILQKRLNILRKFNWLVFVFIFLVVIAGSFVRVTGSGMGCPDWPKCFGTWIPPSQESELPENYKEHYVEYRQKKIDKFTQILSTLGFKQTVKQIQNDPNLLEEQNFNVKKTWTEYANRLCGFLAGNGLLFAFVWLLFIFRERKLVVLSTINLIILMFQAWFGSIVVASNLVPWTITVHMFLALLILGLQLYIIHLLGINIEKLNTNEEQIFKTPKYNVSKWIFVGILLSGFIITYQIFLGTQVRQLVDELTIQGVPRRGWSHELGWSFFVHRSFSWLVLIVIVWMAWINERRGKFSPIRWIFIILTFELLSGIVLVYANMPSFVQITHLVLAVALFCIFTMMFFRIRINN